MKRMKKIFAMLLALTMVLGMTMTASAETTDNKPKKTDTANAVIQNVEDGATVTAYQIVKAKYNDFGFVEYEKANDSLVIADILKPTAEEVTTIAKSVSGLTSKQMEKKESTLYEGTPEETKVITYEKELEAGYWIVLVRGTVDIYNPMLVGVYYDADPNTEGIQGSGDNNSLTSGPVDADSNWTLTADATYAKSTTPSITKVADKETQHVGENVNFTITTTIPDYSKEYTTVKFEIKDKLTNLVLPEQDKNTFKVEITDKDGNKTDVTNDKTVCSIDGIVKESNEFTVSFVSDWLLKRTEIEGQSTGIAENAGKTVTITYTAIVTDGAVNQTEASNKAELTYTNNPGNDTGHDEDTEKVYTFDIDGSVTNNILKKVQKGTVEGTTEALENATFTMYTQMKVLGDEKDVIYSNMDNTDKLGNTTINNSEGNAVPNPDAGTVKSDANGLLHIAGLAEGTYYLKETKAPTGFSLNDTIYKIEIDATFKTEDPEELASWTIKVTPFVKVNGTYVEQTADAKLSKFDVNQKTNAQTLEIEESIGFEQNPTQILNTRLIDLPSTGGIGTTIFTVAGCGIMITAAFFFFASRKKEN